jgi:hypothetical protein
MPSITPTPFDVDHTSPLRVAVIDGRFRTVLGTVRGTLQSKNDEGWVDHSEWAE